MRGWRLRLGWRRCSWGFWFGAFVGRLFLGAVALGVIAWHDGFAFVLAESFFGGGFLGSQDGVQGLVVRFL